MESVLNDYLHSRPDPCFCEPGRECVNCRAWQRRPAVGIAFDTPPLPPPPTETEYQEIKREAERVRKYLQRLQVKQSQEGGHATELTTMQRTYRALRTQQAQMRQVMLRARRHQRQLAISS